MTDAVWPTTRNAARSLPLAAGLFAAAWLVAGAARPRRPFGARNPPTGPAVAWQRLAVAGLGASGLIHLALAPEHFELGAAYGAFFVAVGTAAIVVAAVLLAWPSDPAAVAGTILATELLLLYLWFRVLPPPGATAPEDIELVGLVTQAVQLLGLAACVMMLDVRIPIPRPSRRSG